jgi:hypothetical protein
MDTPAPQHGGRTFVRHLGQQRRHRYSITQYRQPGPSLFPSPTTQRDPASVPAAARAVATMRPERSEAIAPRSGRWPSTRRGSGLEPRMVLSPNRIVERSSVAARVAAPGRSRAGASGDACRGLRSPQRALHLDVRRGRAAARGASGQRAYSRRARTGRFQGVRVGCCYPLSSAVSPGSTGSGTRSGFATLRKVPARLLPQPLPCPYAAICARTPTGAPDHASTPIHNT